MKRNQNPVGMSTGAAAMEKTMKFIKKIKT